MCCSLPPNKGKKGFPIDNLKDVPFIIINFIYVYGGDTYVCRYLWKPEYSVVFPELELHIIAQNASDTGARTQSWNLWKSSHHPADL